MTGIPIVASESPNDQLAAAASPLRRRAAVSADEEGGVAVRPERTFHEMFLDHWWRAHPFNRFQPGVAHRLDRDESGVVVFAKKWCTQRHLRQMMADSNPQYEGGCGVKRCFVALCRGVPQEREGVIEGVHARDGKHVQRFLISKGQHGRRARTEYRVVDTAEHGVFGQVSLVAFTVCGAQRRHQVRATAFRLHTPVVGDTLYGGPKYGRVMLHSCFVGFDGVPHSGMVYGVSCLPQWQHLRHNMYTGRAHFFLKQFVDSHLMKVPRPSKRPRLIQYSLRRERMEMKREALSHRPLLIPFGKGAQPVGSHRRVVDDRKQIYRVLTGKQEEGAALSESDLRSPLSVATEGGTLRERGTRRRRHRGADLLGELVAGGVDERGRDRHVPREDNVASAVRTHSPPPSTLLRGAVPNSHHVDIP